MNKLIVLTFILILLAAPISAQDSSAITIKWPIDQRTVAGTVLVQGTVNPAGLQSYFLEVAPYNNGAPTQWMPVTLPSVNAVVDSVIGMWDTGMVAEGLYALRLHVLLTSGQSVFYVIGPIAVTIDSSQPVQIMATPDIDASQLQAIPTAQPVPVEPTRTPLKENRLPLPVGGHVKYFKDEAIDAMNRAGMTWVKWQIPFEIGQDTVIARDRIQWSHDAGFRVLLSITGEVEQLDEYGAEYYPLFADFLGDVARLGPDAIEVWNEMNIDREWPQGKIDPSAYVEMLRQSYTEIKRNNPEVMVITGALAPTGAEGAFGLERVWNDDRYHLGMANAGAADYADCIGVHYNEGIVSPIQQGGDPRDSYPTRYFPLMLERVAWPFRNTDTALCFTELGYLTPEGYLGPLPENFSWAANTTVEEHAEWLAMAVTIASNYPRLPVELLIVWNIDFDNYVDDPQAGYAIIRPDGSCPACDTISALQR